MTPGNVSQVTVPQVTVPQVTVPQVKVSQVKVRGLPPALRTAQAAIHVQEVQEMMRKLAEYKLGIFMPHMHEADTGDFMVLPDEVMQVESGSEVSFQSRQEIFGQANRFLPVGWIWHAGASTPVAACEMVENERLDDEDRRIQHKMPKRN